MRSRPRLSVQYSPRTPRPGDTVHFVATLESRAETPVDLVRFVLRGVEARSETFGEPRRQRGQVPGQVVNFEAAWDLGALLLAQGEVRVLRFEVELPDDLPPTYRGPLSSIAYRLDCRVDIPWWPDQVRAYEVPVHPRQQEAQVRPAAVSKALRGARETGSHLELALESREVPRGGVVRGALAVNHAPHDRVERVEVRVEAFDCPVGESRLGPQVAWRGEALAMSDGPPADGVVYPFELRVPDDVGPSFRGRLVQSAWQVKARAVIRRGADVTVTLPLDVQEPFGAPLHEVLAPVQVAPLGRERRARLWAEVAQACGLELDAERELMRGRKGPVALEVALEQHPRSLEAVATLSWDELGLELRLAERRWTDGWTGRVETGDVTFDARLSAQCRDAAQVRALLTPAVRARLQDFERVTLDDDGAVLTCRGAGPLADTLEPFTRDALATAEALAAAMATLPLPAGLEARRGPWEALAQQHGGRFVRGDCSVREARYRDGPVELRTRFDDTGKPLAAVARALLRQPRAETAPWPPEAQRALASVATELEGVRVVSDAVEAVLADPARAESTWRALQRVAQALG